MIKSLALRVAAAVLLFSVVLLGITGSSTEIWDGGYPYIASEFTFTDASGIPLPGVTLQVERPLGTVRHHWPVDDFYPGRIPTSDDNGVLRFHCCGHRFGGTCHTYFYVVQVGDCGSPEFFCRFLYRGKEIYTVRFNDIAFPDDYRQRPVVERSLAIPTAEQILAGAIPVTSECPTTNHRFVLVQRTVTLENVP